MSSLDALTSEAEDYGDIWQEKCKNLQSDVERLEARVVALAKREYQITDDKVTKKYRQIRDNLDIWIDELKEEEKKDFKTTYHTNLQNRERDTIFEDVGFKNGCLDLRWQEELGAQETCIYVILGMVITNLLKDLFNEPYPIGVRRSQKKFLDSMMATSAATKDQAMYYRWRGETLSMITSTSDFADHCKDQAEKDFRKLKGHILQWLSPKSLGKHEAALRETIWQPAIDFHRMINCSGKKFQLRNSHSVGSPVPEVAKRWDLVDIVSWRVSRSSDIKGVFHCLWPELIMEAAIDQSNVTFVKPRLLGYKTSNLGPSKTARRSPVRPEIAPTERGTASSKHIQGHRSPQSSRSSTTKDQKSESSIAKDNKSESSTSRFLQRARKALETRSESRPEAKRRGSQPNRPTSTTNTRTSMQDSSRHAHASASDQASRSESETSTHSAMQAFGERTEGMTNNSYLDEGQDRYPRERFPSDPDSSMEVHLDSSIGSANARPVYLQPPEYAHVPVDEAAKAAGIPITEEPENIDE
ncbi:uncharacterized protein PAC_05500 [Phialocephala subalpina]|uniref:Uncharacterized protein n=1 Tax=Phialocephala subalpina TaxID=576137 RepID=A0A1L7WS69_9HELO|nr:uncharacterized protein PAC_05500 [Phialocephala subalpina]